MRFGIQLRNSAPWEVLREVAQAAQETRLHSLWTFDHLLAPERLETSRCLEGWTLLAALAAVTHRVHLGCLVSSVTFRHPSVLAKMAVTVDEICQGRFTLGLGAGWHKREHEAYGIPFPPMSERQDRLEECARLVRALFHDPLPLNFEGRFTRLERADFAPRRAIPIMIGGDGEKRTLRTLALHGDVMNISATSPADVLHKIAVLERHCREVGRDPATIRKTAKLVCRLAESPEHARQIGAKLGADMDDPAQSRHLAIGTADHLVAVFSSLENLGLDEIILQAVEPDPAAILKLDALVLSQLTCEKR